MNVFPEHRDDLVDGANLPPTDNMELCYRPRPLTPEQEARVTLLVALVAPLVLLPLSAGVGWGLQISPLVATATRAFQWTLAATIVLKGLTGAPSLWASATGVAFAAVFAAAAPSQVATVYPGAVRTAAMIGVWLLAALVARQVAAWLVVDPKVDKETIRRWSANVPRIAPHGLSHECPEHLTYAASPLLVMVAMGLAQPMGVWLEGPWRAPAATAASFVATWLAWHAATAWLLPWPGIVRTARATLRALVVFCTYDLHETPAAGVFRFPTRWLRPAWARWAVLLAVAATASAALDRATSEGLAGAVAAALAGSVATVGGVWVAAGSLLARFEDELTVKSTDGGSDWDHLVERLIGSEDALERRHLFCGVTLRGDVPVLLDRELLDQHAHITGDTGASKTTLAAGPLATQLIARGDRTVIIVDLKGDRALFETIRRETLRTRKLPFRWVSNQVGATTYAYNPLVQSHHRRLTRTQIAQELLQGLALDHGLAYGRAYFTAMNEIVLRTVLDRSGAASFQELAELFATPDFYEQFGPERDWQQARHLGALIDRLAGCEPLCVARGDGRPREVYREAIDVADLFQRPQVVYFSLSSATESAVAATVARMLVWGAFSAAKLRPAKCRVTFFLDEFQQLASESMKLPFEQFRGLGGSIVAIHQAAGQLRRNESDLADTVESCTAFKQVLRASDDRSQETLQRIAGTRREVVAGWDQQHDWGGGDLLPVFSRQLARDGAVRTREQETPRLSRRDVQAVSSGQTTSFVRFTAGSGYTQFGGATVPIRSQFMMTKARYEQMQKAPWPKAPGAFRVAPGIDPPPAGPGPLDWPPRPPQGPVGPDPLGPRSYVHTFDERAREDR